MENENSRIDRIHSLAICAEMGDRLRVSLKDQSPLPISLSHRLNQLRDLEEQSPSIVPSMRNEKF